jgi:DNA polymerase III alpha subunit
MLLKTDSNGIPIFSNKNLIDMIYQGHIDKCHVVLCDPNDEIEKFNKYSKEFGSIELKQYIPIDVEQKDFDDVCQSEWFIPNEYKEINPNKWLEAKLMEQLQIDDPAALRDTQEWIRVTEELTEFFARGMYPLLQYMIYLVDFMRKNNIVWGVGRGSSVSSYVLYLIGIHRINPIQFDLDWREFLR